MTKRLIRFQETLKIPRLQEFLNMYYGQIQTQGPKLSRKNAPHV
jgi:hypothetical protein